MRIEFKDLVHKQISENGENWIGPNAENFTAARWNVYNFYFINISLVLIYRIFFKLFHLLLYTEISNVKFYKHLLYALKYL